MLIEMRWLYPVVVLGVLMLLAAMGFLAVGAAMHFRRERAWYAACLGIAAVVDGVALCMWLVGQGNYMFIGQMGLLPYPLLRAVRGFAVYSSWAVLPAQVLAVVGGLGMVFSLRRRGPAGSAPGGGP
jgi:hypothetical protein